MSAKPIWRNNKTGRRFQVDTDSVMRVLNGRMVNSITGNSFTFDPEESIQRLDDNTWKNNRTGTTYDVTTDSVRATPGPALRPTFAMYYFGEWTPLRFPGIPDPDPWTIRGNIRTYRGGEREPIQGWYDDSLVEVVRQQMDQMIEYDIDFVCHAYYYMPDRVANNLVPLPSMQAYWDMDDERHRKLPYCLLWCQHFAEPNTLLLWDAVIDDWCFNNFNRNYYYKIDGKPVIVIFSIDDLHNQCQAIGYPNAKAMLDHARNVAKLRGYKDIHFIICAMATSHWNDFATQAGADGLTAYNYHNGVAGGNIPTRYSESFSELDSCYQMQWRWFLENSQLDYYLPLMAGWDSRPWGGVGQHQNSQATTKEFENHIRHGYNLVLNNQSKTRSTVFLCCWNEYGEGSIAEPTAREWITGEREGFDLLNMIRKVYRPEGSEVEQKNVAEFISISDSNRVSTMPSKQILAYKEENTQLGVSIRIPSFPDESVIGSSIGQALIYQE
jgi:hypothetical protein